MQIIFANTVPRGKTESGWRAEELDMGGAISGRTPVPAHIPPELVRDFDFFAPPGADEDVHLAWKQVQDEGPEVFWTPRNGGHWIATRAEDIREVQFNFERFSQRVLTLPADAYEQTLLPINVDPPVHGPYRKLIMPAFLPRAIDQLDSAIRQAAAELVDELAPRGECEFVEDFARKMPISVFLKIVDLPYDDRPFLLGIVDRMREPDPDAGRRGMAEVVAYLGKWVEERRARPGDDIISTVVHGEIDGRPITDHEIFQLLTVILLGGLDTVTSLLGFICRFLAMSPAHRHLLVAHPELRRNAVEELIRRHGVVATARYITEDFVSRGVQFRAGDIIQIPNCLYGLDERLNPDPLTVDFERESIQHGVFGNGPHTCPGAVLTRRELTAFLEFWLEKIPDFEIRPGSRPKMYSAGVNGVSRLELVWTPPGPA